MDQWLTPDDAEDSAFYAELTRQILLLTDDNDHDEPQVKNKSARQRLVGSGGLSLIPGNYFNWSENDKVSVPGWMEKLWQANGGGTGVFIPRGGVHRFRRRHNKPKKNPERSRVQTAAGYKNLGSS